MTHANSILSLILAAVAVAVAATPAAADPGFQTDAFLGPNAASTVNADGPGYGGDAKDLYVQSLGSSHALASRGDTKDLYVQSLPPSRPTSTPTATAEIGGDAFSWGDALLGALLASGLLVGVFAATRRRGVSAESHA